MTYALGRLPGDHDAMRQAAEALLARQRELMAAGRSYAEARRFASAERPDLVRLAAGGPRAVPLRRLDLHSHLQGQRAAGMPGHDQEVLEAPYPLLDLGC